MSTLTLAVALCTLFSWAATSSLPYTSPSQSACSSGAKAQPEFPSIHSKFAGTASGSRDLSAPDCSRQYRYTVEIHRLKYGRNGQVLLTTLREVLMAANWDEASTKSLWTGGVSACAIRNLITVAMGSRHSPSSSSVRSQRCSTRRRRAARSRFAPKRAI